MLLKRYAEKGIRVVPNAVARYGAYISSGVILPSYVNIGAYVDEGTMVDTWATVGSCAQIGKMYTKWWCGIEAFLNLYKLLQ
jgi:2,3,4,5-tetrahydropyridine-2-carboxylate N-succinyltransferase